MGQDSPARVVQLVFLAKPIAGDMLTTQWIGFREIYQEKLVFLWERLWFSADVATISKALETKEDAEDAKRKKAEAKQEKKRHNGRCEGSNRVIVNCKIGSNQLSDLFGYTYTTPIVSDHRIGTSSIYHI